MNSGILWKQNTLTKAQIILDSDAAQVAQADRCRALAKLPVWLSLDAAVTQRVPFQLGTRRPVCLPCNRLGHHLSILQPVAG